MDFKEINAEELAFAPVKEIGTNWALLTGNKPDGEFNSMTVSWGGAGVLWGKPCVFVFVRPQRYTYGFMEEGEYFSLSLMPDGYHEKMAVFGSKSGRDTDKYAVSGLGIGECDGVKYCADANKVFICRKKAASDMNADWFEDSSLDGRFYAAKDYHKMYIGEIVKILVKE